MTEKKQEKFIIIDGNAIIHRAYHAIPPLMIKDGTIVNAVYGFTSMLLKVITDLKPEYLALSFDVAGRTFRDEMYKDYKANRKKADDELYAQFPLVYDVVKAFGIPIYTKKGFEADDVMATITDKNEKNNKNIKNIIVTGDKDLLQLVTKKTNIYLLKKGLSEYILCDEKKVFEMFSFVPKKIVDYKALRGDPSDNIPGIKGIGDKTAKKLIHEIGGIAEIFKQIKNENSNIYKNFSKNINEKIKNGENDSILSAKLATVKKDIKNLNFDFKKTKFEKLDNEKIIKLLQKFEFFSLIKRLPGHKIENKEEEKEEEIIKLNEKDYSKLINIIEKEKIFTCTQINNLSQNDLSFIFKTKEKTFLIKKTNFKKLTFFQNKDIVFVGHNIKNIIKTLKINNIEVKNQLFDIMIASYILNSSTRAHDIPSIAIRELGIEISEEKNQNTLFTNDFKKEEKEIKIIFDTYPIYKQKLEDMENLGLFEKIEMNLIPVLAQMEINGVKIDLALLEKISKETHKKIKELTKKIWNEAEEEFNIASSVQLREILFEKMDLPTFGIKKGKTGYSTAASELEKLRNTNPIIKLIEKFRELEKLRNTYIDVLPKLIDKKFKRIHTTYNQAITTTGRLSSSEPNIQNIPIRTEEGRKIRESFISEKGKKLIVADYSQIELRIVASLAEDEKMLEIFEKDQDIHKATAAKIHNLKIENVTKEIRNAAKAINFGVLYGMGSYGLAQRTGLTNYEAQDFINKYFKAFSQVKTYLDNTLEEAKKTGFVETLFGRRRYIPELKSKNKQIKNSGKRMAINMPVQGTAADIMKIAMINISNRIKKENLEEKIKMILQVHDEIVIEAEEKYADIAAKILKEEMENVTKLRVKIKAEVEIGTSWGKIK